MDKVRVIDNEVYVNVDTLLDFLYGVADDMSTLAMNTANEALANQVLGVIFVGNALEKVQEVHKPA